MAEQQLEGGHHITRLRDGSVMAISHGWVGGGGGRQKSKKKKIRKQNFGAPGLMEPRL
jgi:hypothetical protein